jgi:ATP-dependent RNA helicase RhlE
VIVKLLRERDIKQSIVFVNSKLGCARLARSFERDGLRTSALHGDKSQDERIKALDAFKRGEVDMLVATDVAARGIDIAALPAVFNFDIPFNAEDYVHRIGRTGRAGASGLAVSLVSGSDARLMADIEKLIKKKIDVESIEVDGGHHGRSTYRRERGEEDSRPEGAAAGRGEPRESSRDSSRDSFRDAAPREVRSSRPAPRRSSDPFFDKPYEPSNPQATAVWDNHPEGTASDSGMAGSGAGAAGSAANGGGISRFIKPKRKVASLLGGSGTAGK